MDTEDWVRKAGGEERTDAGMGPAEGMTDQGHAASRAWPFPLLLRQQLSALTAAQDFLGNHPACPTPELIGVGREASPGPDCLPTLRRYMLSIPSSKAALPGLPAHPPPTPADGAAVLEAAWPLATL